MHPSDADAHATAMVHDPPRPAFTLADHIVALERGLDLADDDRKRAELEPLAAADPPELTAYGWCRLATVRWRAGEFEAAAVAFERAAAEGYLPLDMRFLAAVAGLRAGASGTDAALEELLPALADSTDDGDEDNDDDDDAKPTRRHVDAALVRLALADHHWHRGDLQRAREGYEEVVGDGSSGERWAELGRLRAATGDPAGARVAFTAAAKEFAGSHCDYMLARLHAAGPDADVEAAAEALRAALYDEAYHPLARVDPALATIITRPEIAEVLDPPPPDLAWLEAFPWFAALRDDPRLAEVEWLPKESADEETGRMRETFSGTTLPMGTLWTDALWEAAVELAATRRVIARGRPVLDRDRIARRPAIYICDDEPGTLWISGGPEFAPFLWVPVAAEADALADLLAALAPKERVAVGDQPTHRRAFMGFRGNLRVPNPYSGGLDPAGFHELDRYWTMSPYLDSRAWGSAQTDDPWPDQIPPQPAYMLRLGVYGKELRAQAEGGVCRFTRRTTTTRSYVGYELHRKRFYVWDLRYTPSPWWPRYVKPLNERFGTSYPEDLPPDVLGAILGFDFQESAALEAAASETEHPGELGAYLQAIAAIRHSDLSVHAFLRPFLTHRDLGVRADIANACLEYNWYSLLEDLAFAEHDPELREQMADVLRGTIGAPEYDEHGEPLGLPDLYGGDEGDEGDEDDEDDGGEDD